MANQNPKPGEVWNLKAKPAIGTKMVEITAVKGNVITGAFGRLSEDEDGTAVFLRKSFAPAGGGVAKRSAVFAREDFAEYLRTVKENTMATKKENASAPEGELTYEMDDAAAAPAEGQSVDAPAKGGKAKMSAKERAAAILKADREKEKAKKEKEAAAQKEKERKEKEKAQKAAEKRAEGLRDLAQKAGLKEAEEAPKYNPEAKKFTDLTEEQAKTAKDALKEAVKAKNKQDKLALASNLTADEEKERGTLEKIVEKYLGNFQQAAFQIGGALTAISQKKLYRNTHKTFEAYVSERFGLSKPHAYSVMNAAYTFTALTEGEAVDAKSLPSITAAEAITRGVRGLLKDAGMQDSPEVEAVTRQLARNAYQLAVQNAPVDKDGQPILSPDHLTSTFSVLSQVAKSGVVTVDGKDMPVNLAAAAMDEMITTESKERSDRFRQTLADRIEAAKAQAVEARKSKLDDALASATSGNGAAIPAGVEPKLNAICSVHGRVALEDSSDTDVTLGCGCVFVHTPEGFKFDKNKNA